MTRVLPPLFKLLFKALATPLAAPLAATIPLLRRGARQ